MSGLTANILDMNADSVHDDVELILESSGPDIIELIASDPSYYLNIVANYNKTRDGRDIYLQDLCNMLITKSSGEYRIKFKLSDNGQWYEVGYCGSTFTEDEVHEAFCKKVKYALSRPVNAHRNMINNSLLDNGSPSSSTEDEASPPGSVMSYSKIDKFMNRIPNIHKPTVADVPVDPEISLGMPPAPTTLPPPHYCLRRTQQSHFLIHDDSVPTPSLPQQASDIDHRHQELNDAFQDLIKQRAMPLPPTGHAPAEQQRDILEETTLPTTSNSNSNFNFNFNSNSNSSNFNLTLELLTVICPVERKESFLKLVELLTSQDTFIQGLIELLPKLNAGQRMLVISFLN
jgi:hypothetical protein